VFNAQVLSQLFLFFDYFYASLYTVGWTIGATFAVKNRPIAGHNFGGRGEGGNLFGEADTGKLHMLLCILHIVE